MKFEPEGPLANTRKKNLKNDGETGCGWLYQNHKSPENSTPKHEKYQEPTENQTNTKIEI